MYVNVIIANIHVLYLCLYHYCIYNLFDINSWIVKKKKCIKSIATGVLLFLFMPPWCKNYDSKQKKKEGK